MSKRKPVIVANWKMHKNHLESIHFVESLRNRLDPSAYDKVEIAICPPFTAIRSVQTTIDGDSLQIAVGAQNMHWEDAGAYTGEVSAPMLLKLGVSFVILGHSERRELFGETDGQVNRKVKVALEAGLTPILCVGETLAEREAGATSDKVSRQVQAGLEGVSKGQAPRCVLAYEPIWAIGTGKTASSQDAQETIGLIRQVTKDALGDVADEIRILYGGSVKAGNIADLMSMPDIDGALVGGASLDPQEFARIIMFDRAAP